YLHLSYYNLLISNYTACIEFYFLSLHDALPILKVFRPNSSILKPRLVIISRCCLIFKKSLLFNSILIGIRRSIIVVSLFLNCSRSEEHTSELQSRFDLVCCLLLEKKKI